MHSFKISKKMMVSACLDRSVYIVIRRFIAQPYGSRLIQTRRDASSSTISETLGSSSLSSFEELCKTRSSVTSFDNSKAIDPSILQRILKVTQTAPSSFNLQPFKMVLIQSKEMKEHLASAMLGNNVKKVLDAPATIIFMSLKGTIDLYFGSFIAFLKSYFYFL